MENSPGKRGKGRSFLPDQFLHLFSNACVYALQQWWEQIHLGKGGSQGGDSLNRFYHPRWIPNYCFKEKSFSQSLQCKEIDWFPSSPTLLCVLFVAEALMLVTSLSPVCPCLRLSLLSPLPSKELLWSDLQKRVSWEISKRRQDVTHELPM